MHHDRLKHLEDIVAKNQYRFVTIGKALKEIRDSRLYRLTLHETFEAYGKARWDMGRSQIYRLISAYSVVNNLSPNGDILPANEAQVRPLVQLDPPEQRKVWKDFIDTGLEITAPNIKRFIADRKVPKKTKPVDLTDQISPAYMEAVEEILSQIQLAQNDHWQTTSHQAALLWNKVVREKILSKEVNNGHR